MTIQNKYRLKIIIFCSFRGSQISVGAVRAFLDLVHLVAPDIPENFKDAMEFNSDKDASA